VPRSRVGIFLKNAPDPPHWTLNSYFGVSCTIWMHLGPFGCLTKLSAKRAELMQKYVPWSRVIIFRNEHTRLSPLGLKLMFWCVSYYLGAFGAVWLRYNTLCKMDQLGAKVRATKSHRNFSQRMHLIHPHCTLNTCFGVFCTIWMYLEPFGCLTKLCAKRAKLVQKYVPWSRFGMFHNEPLNPPHWTLTSCFRAFCTTWVHLWQFGSFTTLSTKWAKFFRN